MVTFRPSKQFKNLRFFTNISIEMVVVSMQLTFLSGDIRFFCVQTFIADHPEVAVIDPIESVRLLSDRSVYYPIMRECEIKDAGTV